MKSLTAVADWHTNCQDMPTRKANILIHRRDSQLLHQGLKAETKQADKKQVDAKLLCRKISNLADDKYAV